MKNTYLNLDKILDLKKWQALQDSLAIVTKLAIITVDYKGNPITSHSSCTSFCQSVRSDPTLSKYCQKCDSRGGLEAVRTNAPYIYLCHYQIIDIAIPIIVDDKYVGAVMAGQVRLKDSKEHHELEQILSSKSSFGGNEKMDALLPAYHSMPSLSFFEIEQSSHMLSCLCNYIVEEAMNKNLILEMYEKMPLSIEKKRTSEELTGYPLENMEHLKKELSDAVTNAYIKASPEQTPAYQNPVLRPALDYIYQNKAENATQKELASLCHISPSYFSRLFTKETGENFSAYLSRLKIEWAKQLLEKTDLTITHISDELGFYEPGYFIRTFKKYEKVTPSLYRKYYKN